MPGRNHLFVPGPTNTPDRILRAMHVAMEDHRSSSFPELPLGLFAELRKIFKTRDGQPFIFPASGTGGWEAALSNTLSPGDKVLSFRFEPAGTWRGRIATRDGRAYAFQVLRAIYEAKGPA